METEYGGEQVTYQFFLAQSISFEVETVYMYLM